MRIKERKNLLDCYYTKPEIIDKCVEYIYQYCDISNHLLIDTSCGTNYFAYKMNMPSISVDVNPNIKFKTKQNKILEYNFLKIKLKCNKPLIMGFNPPFGLRNELSKKFLKKIYLYKPEYITIILLNSTSIKWNFPNYQTLYTWDIPNDSFYNEKTIYNIPCKFYILKRKELFIEQEDYDFLPRAIRYKSKNNNYSIKRSLTILPNNWCSIAVRYCGVNAGKHYYIYHHNQIYFYDYNKSIFEKIHTIKHKILNVFTVINFSKNISFKSLENIVDYLYNESTNYINYKGIRYNFNTSDVKRIMDSLNLS